MEKHRENFSFLLIALLIFISVCAFFSSVQPIVPWTNDHWATLSWYNSGVLPMDAGNTASIHPTRIFPKVSQTIFGLISAYVIYPVLGDYLQSMVIFLAFLIAISATALYVFIYRFLCVFTKEKTLALCLSVFMIVLYFAMFKSGPENNPFMMWCVTQTMAFWFVIPNLINSILVLWLLRKRINQEDLSFSSMNYLTSGTLFCVVYFAMFSNLFACVIFFCYAMFDLLLKIIQIIRTEKDASFIKSLKGYWINIVTILLFIIHCIVDYTAGRASELKVDLPFGEALKLSVESFMKLLSCVDKKLIIFALVLVMVYVYCRFFYGKKNQTSDELKNLNYSMLVSCINAIFLMAFYVIVTAKAGEQYASRIDCMYGFYFFSVLLLILICLYVMKIAPKSAFVLPFTILIFGVQMTRVSMPLSDRYHYDYLTAKQRYSIMHEWVERVKQASDNRQDSVILYRPYYISPKQDVVDFGSYSSMTETMRAHGVISEPVAILIRYSDDIR